MKMFKVKQGTRCCVRRVDTERWIDCTTQHENVFNLEEIDSDPITTYNEMVQERGGTPLGVDFNTIPYVFFRKGWYLKVYPDQVEVI